MPTSGVLVPVIPEDLGIVFTVKPHAGISRSAFDVNSAMFY